MKHSIHSFSSTACMLLLPIALVTSGCGKKEEKVETTELDGTWVSACIAKEKSNDDNNTEAVESHTKGTLVVSKGSMEVTQKEYKGTDATCAGATSYTIQGTATYTVGADVATPAGAKIFDSTVTKFSVTLQTQEMVDGFNGGSFCGAADWVLNTAKDVTTATCGEGGDSRPNNAPTFDIYDVDGTTLRFGDNNSVETDGSTAAKRPTALSTTDDVYTKQ